MSLLKKLAGLAVGAAVMGAAAYVLLNREHGEDDSRGDEGPQVLIDLLIARTRRGPRATAIRPPAAALRACMPGSALAFGGIPAGAFFRPFGAAALLLPCALGCTFLPAVERLVCHAPVAGAWGGPLGGPALEGLDRAGGIA